MFSRKTRKGLLGGVALALAGLMAGEAGAAGGILMTQAYCNSFTNPRDVIWAQLQSDQNNNQEYENVFYMRRDGTIVRVKGQDDFQNLDTLFITSHGSCGAVGGIGNTAFAQNIRKEQNDQSELKNVLTVSCQAGSRTNNGNGPSLLSELQKHLKLDDTAVISGWAGNVALVGGGGVLKDTRYTDKRRLLDQNLAAASGFTLSAINARWAHQSVNLELLAGKQFANIFKTHCENVLSVLELTGMQMLDAQEREAMFTKFNDKLRETFLPVNANDNPIRSFAYRPSLFESGGDYKILCGPGTLDRKQCP
ncbi:hypothetical protein [Pseudovibrio sp. FO-BEG1]|uniref:hypothetical protein n=1 Tax=Pseudovibrio sp. (strain FO-BEG1) TaxID=911045 RepID=UPI00031148C8|nr:hypothetical protein [Pseudovibrio sp. FO-BEG1]